MKVKKRMWYVTATIGIILIAWLILTLYVEQKGPAKKWSFGVRGSTHNALIVFDPDPFCNLDEKVCASFASALAEDAFVVELQTVAMAEAAPIGSYDLIVYCANTYNWRPDWAVIDFVRSIGRSHENKPIVAITLGAGSTQTSQEYFEREIAKRGGNLFSSYSLWLWRPNDETKPGYPNVDVAVNMAYEWGKATAIRFK